MNYQDAWNFLDNLQFFKIKLGLDSMAAFLDSVDNPQRDLRFVHVAGTNGKGSVAVTLVTILAEAGCRVGLYTSPHLSSVRERFRINDEYISREDFGRLSGRIIEVLAGRQITYFEFTTALALLWFAEQKVDLVILEVGLGGRLDATNVVTPLVSVITNVTMDHEAYLGTTLAAIAGEKAGIIKPGVPVVSGVAYDVSRMVVEDTCRAKEAPLYLLGRNFSGQPMQNGAWSYAGINAESSRAGLQCVLSGRHQIDNAAVSLAVLELLADHGFMVQDTQIRKGLSQVRWPGRLEHFCLTWPARKRVDCLKTWEDSCQIGNERGCRRFLLDGAHNPDGVECLKKALRENFSFEKLIMVWASMSDKDYTSSLINIAPLCDRIIFTRPESERSATLEEMKLALPETLREKALVATSVAEALDKAAGCAVGGDLICVAGSLYLVGAARRELLGELAL